MNTLTISNTPIRQDNQGRYLLNDLHKAAGEDQKHKPANFLRLDVAQELCDEIDRCSDMRSIKIITGKGNQQGTYVVKELVYAYAMWISPKFHLQVIRTFDALSGSYSNNSSYSFDTKHFVNLQSELLKANPRLQDVLNLTRLGYSQARIGEMLGLGHTAVYKAVKRLRHCGFVVCADAARLPVPGGAQ